jgi:signal transduction histidine kinase
MLENLVLAQIADLINDPVIASDEHGRVVFCNSAYSKIAGWSFEEIKNCNFKLLYDLPEGGRTEIALKIGVLYCKGGEKLTLSATCSPLSHPSVPSLLMGRIVVFHPELIPTDRKSSDDFVSTVSHELRTPLTSIKGFADTLLQSIDRLKEHDRKRFLQIIKDQADHLTRLVEDLLFVSRLDNHTIHLVMRELDLKKQVDKVCEAIASQSGGRVFVYDIDTALPKVIADSDRLEQILRNLISNSIKYSPENGSITIRAMLDPNNFKKVKVSVVDNGVGIPQENQEVIFNRFSRLDNPLTRKTKGTGLGLYITKSLVQAMEGDIWLEKSDLQETAFSFTLKASANMPHNQ